MCVYRKSKRGFIDEIEKAVFLSKTTNSRKEKSRKKKEKRKEEEKYENEDDKKGLKLFANLENKIIYLL